ncbi:MarR family winged helix-turn-helix transcriptional regulator [Caulobacter hibisci]|uniref:MarR family transcriptional regulator n=1 Tax=Caulobacter hibisci TaxID=2035993 RepID=A0ABS0T2N3_9CAUL|nr:MarR family transcriptional regulator [Caulobacter hibisci]MBI1685919.1 MarR family transcriptional regulator [Caulobacter hibisci]
MSTNNVHNAHISQSLPSLHRSLIDLMGAMNEPERDAAMLQAAGLTLERALFPLLVSVERLGPIGVVELAGRVGRDHTTVSRQVARLEALGLVTRQAGAADRRVREAVITPEGKIATDAVDAARERMAQVLFKDWSGEDFDHLVRLLRKLADGINADPAVLIGGEAP